MLLAFVAAEIPCANFAIPHHGPSGSASHFKCCADLLVLLSMPHCTFLGLPTEFMKIFATSLLPYAPQAPLSYKKITNASLSKAELGALLTKPINSYIFGWKSVSWKNYQWELLGKSNKWDVCQICKASVCSPHPRIHCPNFGSYFMQVRPLVAWVAHSALMATSRYTYNGQGLPSARP